MGNNVYVASDSDDAVGILDRDGEGALMQKTGTAGCVADGGLGGDCQDGRAMIDASEVVVSPDGANVYVASTYPQPGGVAILDRGTGGALTQKAGAAGCISENGLGPRNQSSREGPSDCQDGKALLGAVDLAVEPRRRQRLHRLALFQRDRDSRSRYGWGADPEGRHGRLRLGRR